MIDKRDSKKIVRAIKSVGDAQIYISDGGRGLEAIININNVLMARISARDAQTLKEADYKKPVIHMINVKYEHFEAQFNNVIELNNMSGAVDWFNFKYTHPYNGAVLQLGNIDGGLFAVDDHYKVIAESLNIAEHKIRGGGPGKPIFYIGFDDKVQTVIAPCDLNDIPTFNDEWETFKKCMV